MAIQLRCRQKIAEATHGLFMSIKGLIQAETPRQATQNDCLPCPSCLAMGTTKVKKCAERKIIFCTGTTGLTRATKSIVPERPAQWTSQGRTPFMCTSTPRVPSLNSQEGVWDHPSLVSLLTNFSCNLYSNTNYKDGTHYVYWSNLFFTIFVLLTTSVIDCNIKEAKIRTKRFHIFNVFYRCRRLSWGFATVVHGALRIHIFNFLTVLLCCKIWVWILIRYHRRKSTTYNFFSLATSLLLQIMSSLLGWAVLF